MGLGKTLQSICILASDHNERANKYLATKEPEFSRIPSLVVCPTSLCHHWNDEITKYAPFLKVVMCVGSPLQRDVYILLNLH